MVPEPKWVIPDLIEHLRALDKQQYETDEAGGAEIAWYYYRDGIEDILGLERGTLDTSPPPDTVDDADGIR